VAPGPRPHLLPQVGEDALQPARQYGTLGRQGRPPPYHILPRASYLLIPQDTPDLLSESRIQADTVLHSLSQSLGRVDGQPRDEEEESLYQATKF
jgi:hypothetical protein